MFTKGVTYGILEFVVKKEYRFYNQKLEMSDTLKRGYKSTKRIFRPQKRRGKNEKRAVALIRKTNSRSIVYSSISNAKFICRSRNHDTSPCR